MTMGVDFLRIESHNASIRIAKLGNNSVKELEEAGASYNSHTLFRPTRVTNNKKPDISKTVHAINASPISNIRLGVNRTVM